MTYHPGLKFYEVVKLAVDDFAEHGFDSIERLNMWKTRIEAAALNDLVPEHVLTEQLRSTFQEQYRRLIERGGILKHHAGVAKFTIDNVAPKLRDELTRRIMVSADLVRLNRQKAIQQIHQRLSGWASSIPAGGSDATDKPEAKRDIRKAITSLPFLERRVIIDQGHKFVGNLNDIIATDLGAIAAVWHSHYREANYNYRVDHKDRDSHVYLIRDSWAHEKGLVKKGSVGYFDEITKPGEEVFCRCWVTYLYALRSLPVELLTAKGKGELQRVRLVA